MLNYDWQSTAINGYEPVQLGGLSCKVLVSLLVGAVRPRESRDDQSLTKPNPKHSLTPEMLLVEKGHRIGLVMVMH